MVLPGRQSTSPCAADPYLGRGLPPDFTLFFSCCFLLYFRKDFRRILDTLWGIIFNKKSEKRRLQCSMKRAYENGPGKKCGLGGLRTSKTSSACGREHDSVVLLDSRKSLIFDVFWSSILELLGPSCAENLIFWGV